VEEFYKDHKLEDVVDVELLKRGALLARDREEFMEDNILSSVERRALLREEKPKFWQQTRELKTVLLTCCIGAIVQYANYRSFTSSGSPYKRSLIAFIEAGRKRISTVQTRSGPQI
jgi:hypothetical protein